MGLAERRRWAGRLVLLLTLLGLVAMHGLADGLARPSSAPGMQARTTTLTTRTTWSTAPVVAMPTGCGMDHGNCVAVLRDAGHLSAAGPATFVHTDPGLPVLPAAPTPARGSRAPPDVSLIGLGISRT